MLREVEVVWENDREKITLRLTEANVIRGIRRSRIVNDMRDAISADAEDESPEGVEKMSFEEKLVRIYSYPTCIGSIVEATVEAKIDPETSEPFELEALDLVDLSFEQFAGLPESLAVVWEEASVKLNPHWLPQGQDSKNPPDGEQQPSPSINGSSDTSMSETNEAPES